MKNNKIIIVLLLIVGIIAMFWQKIVAKTAKKASASALESFRETEKVGEIAKGVGKQAATGAVDVALNWVKDKINK